ncbi:YhcB family protein [Motilimonas cestriensis]|uniref:YhcB family protein n=1 Tax=Motilimonas cestriensis TaxID=2742685 RepID=UPI003DA502E4
MTEITLISTFIFALIIGFMIGRRFPSNKQAAQFEKQVTSQQQKMNDYQHQLDKCQAQIKQQTNDQSKYQQQVSTHFAKTADLMDSIANQYQTLYQYMAQQSEQLLPEAEANRNISIFRRNKRVDDTTSTDSQELETKATELNTQQDGASTQHSDNADIKNPLAVNLESPQTDPSLVEKVTPKSPEKVS